MPRTLIARLILSVVGVVPHLVLLPTKSPFTLACNGRAKCLTGDLRAYDEDFATACTGSGAHQTSPFE